MSRSSSEPNLPALSRQILCDGSGTVGHLPAALALLDKWSAAGWTRSTPLALNGTDPGAALAYWCARVFKRGLRRLTWDGEPTTSFEGLGMGPESIATPEYVSSRELLGLLVAELGKGKVICIIDAGFLRCWPNYASLAATSSNVIVYEPSESTKRLETIASWAARLAPLLESNRDGGSEPLRVWSVGGGITSDLAGFFAGLFGLDHCSSPTTLLSAYDASLGGKTGANLPPWGKNQVGLFYPTTRWVIAAEHFSTLGLTEILGAMAEAIKHCWLAGSSSQDQLSRINSLCTVLRKRPAKAANRVDGTNGADLAAGSALDDDFVRSSISFNHEVKAAFVRADPLEGGVRAALNLGHTLGHILEGLADEGWIRPIAHGLAVATGFKFLFSSGLLSDEDRAFEPVLDTLLSTAQCLPPFLVHEPAPGQSGQALATRFWERFASLARADKKSTSMVRLVLPKKGLASDLDALGPTDRSLFRDITPDDLAGWCRDANLFTF